MTYPICKIKDCTRTATYKSKNKIFVRPNGLCNAHHVKHYYKNIKPNFKEYTDVAIDLKPFKVDGGELSPFKHD